MSRIRELLPAAIVAAFSLTFLAAPAPAGATDFPCSPASEFLESLEGGGIDPAFCAEWNPEFSFRGFRCCAKPRFASSGGRRKRRGKQICAPNRIKTSYCDEMTEEQRHYSEEAESGKLGDILQLIAADGRRSQAYCNTNDGFLAYGRRVIPSSVNHIVLKSPNRCVDFGTDGMVGMLEWLGRQTGTQYSTPEYQRTHLLIGDVAAPRGGCLSGRRGRRGHASHTSGQDVDIGFLTPKKNAPSPVNFHKQFDPQTNWWLIKKIFQNPYACVKVIFLDRKLIGKLARVASQDPEWAELHKYVRHVKFHKNHMHVRIGDHPGEPGCHATDLDDEVEDEETSEATEVEASVTPDPSATSRPEASAAPARAPASAP